MEPKSDALNEYSALYDALATWRGVCAARYDLGLSDLSFHIMRHRNALEEYVFSLECRVEDPRGVLR